MTYDHWKTTEPDYDSGNYPPDDLDDEGAYEDGLNRIKDIARGLKAERDRAIADLVKYEAALRKIAAWKGYDLDAKPYPFKTRRARDNSAAYERGANDMLATLKQMAEEALS